MEKSSVLYEFLHHYNSSLLSVVLVYETGIVNKSIMYRIYLDTVRNERNVLLYDDFEYFKLDSELIGNNIIAILQSKLSNKNRVVYVTIHCNSDLSEITDKDVYIYHSRQDKIRNLMGI